MTTCSTPLFGKKTEEERYAAMHKYQFCLNDKEPAFDAADITRVGKDIFVQRSMTTNAAGIDWLTRSLEGVVRVHPCHFPYDLAPSHMDCTFVPLRPPSGGEDGLVLINPDRPPLKSESQLWLNNGWRFVAAPQPSVPDRPAFSQSSKWLSMNLLSLSEKCVVIEENEVPLYNVLDDLGFDVVTTPFRHVFENGGSLHCATWDIKRADSCVDYFPNVGCQPEKHKDLSAFFDVDVIDPSVWEAPSKTAPKVVPAASTEQKTEKEEKKEVPTGFLVQGSHYDEWNTVNADISEEHVYINNQPVMELWERPYMEALADETCTNGGVVLEVGFGLGLSATCVQRHQNVTEHIIIEGNADVGKRLYAFAAEQERLGNPKVTPKIGMWQEVVKTLPRHSVDAILYDPYPNCDAEQHIHQFMFMKEMWDILKPGGTFVYCNLTSTGVLKNSYATWNELFEVTQRPHLYMLGFRDIPDPKVFNFTPEMIAKRGGCEYFQHASAMIPKLIKPSE
eukprot:NODE_89_length_2520_cov_519.399838_g70_i0.p1 GENE.NODE_89_length_2520_cov_519.399838_g70_i0~~NODE_89_length_2520_cov_519.399838_g70_i0.p1  ORF type:complete len:506 (+),score=123.04 NODE_89_length_2520_cov_519.399838_g70_i0:683-2200(+)